MENKKNLKKNKKTMAETADGFFMQQEKTIHVQDKPTSLLKPSVKEETPREETIYYEDAVLAGANKKVKMHYNTSNRFFSAGISAINLFVVLGIFLIESNLRSVVSIQTLFSSSQFNFAFIGCIVAALVVIITLETLGMFIGIWSVNKTKLPKVSYGASVLNKYYKNQSVAFEILYLHKNNVRGETALNLPQSKQLILKQAAVLLAIVALITNASVLYSNLWAIWVVALVGAVYVMLYLTIIILFILHKNFATQGILKACLLLDKGKFVKDGKALFNKVLGFLIGQERIVKYYLKNVWQYVVNLLIAIFNILLQALIIVFIYFIFNTNTELLLNVFAKAILLETIFITIPLSRKMGIAEIMFILLYLTSFTAGTIVWAVIIWRLLAHGLYMLQGFVFIFVSKKKKQVN